MKPAEVFRLARSLALGAAVGIGIPTVMTSQAIAQGILGGFGGGNKSAPAASPEAAQSSFLSKFTAARIQMNAAQISLAQAFGLKDAVTQLEAEKTTLTSGTLDVNGFNKAKELSGGVSKALAEKMAAGAVLDAKGKATFATAFDPLAQGTLLTIELPGAAKAWADAAQAAASAGSLMEKAKLLNTAQAAGAVAMALPDFASVTIDNYKKVLEFGKANQIPIPKSATDALGSL